jgi:uncharacterized coiled-coil protein SlyX
MANGALRLEERVAHVEGHVSELSLRLTSVEGAIRQLEQRMDLRFETMDRRIDALDAKMSHHFAWLVGIMVTTLLAVMGTVLSTSATILSALSAR